MGERKTGDNMSRFKKKPVVIDAVQWTGDFDAISEFVGNSEYVLWLNKDGTIDVPTLSGTVCAQQGDWIIRGVKGEFYLCKPDIFEATYEAAGE